MIKQLCIAVIVLLASYGHFKNNAPIEFCIDSIFYGSYGAAFMLLISMRLHENWLNRNIFIESCNLLILVWILSQAISVLIYTLSVWFSGVEFEQFAFLNRLFGPYAFFLWVSLLLLYLPSLIFISKRQRRSFKSTLIIITLWTLIPITYHIFLISSEMHWYMPIFDYTSIIYKLLVYMPLLSLTYWMLLKSKNLEVLPFEEK